MSSDNNESGPFRLTTTFLTTPLSFMCVGDVTKIVGKHLNTLAGLLHRRLNPSMQRLPQRQNVVGDARVPGRVDLGNVSVLRNRLLKKNSSLLSCLHHRNSLSQRRNNRLRKVGAEGDELNRRRWVNQTCSLRDLIVFPGADRAIRAPRNTQRSADVDLLDKKVIGQDLCKHFGLLPTLSIGQNNRRCTNCQRDQGRKPCDERRKKTSHSRHCCPNPCGCRGDLGYPFKKHCRLPLGTGRHSGTSAAYAEGTHG